MFANFISENINIANKSCLFPAFLKSAYVTPVHKKVKRSKRKLYTCILPILSKAFERTMFAQMSNFLEQFLLT